MPADVLRTLEVAGRPRGRGRSRDLASSLRLRGRHDRVGTPSPPRCPAPLAAARLVSAASEPRRGTSRTRRRRCPPGPRDLARRRFGRTRTGPPLAPRPKTEATRASARMAPGAARTIGFTMARTRLGRQYACSVGSTSSRHPSTPPFRFKTSWIAPLQQESCRPGAPAARAAVDHHGSGLGRSRRMRWNELAGGDAQLAVVGEVGDAPLEVLAHVHEQGIVALVQCWP